MAELPIRAFISSLVAVREGKAGHEVLLLKRAETLIGEWCQIAGKIEEGETAWQAAVRELSEETALSPQKLYSADICEQFYEADRDEITLAPVFVAFVGQNAQVALNNEHSDFRWVSFTEAVEMVAFGGQRRILRWIEEEFILRLPSEHLYINMSNS
ncbi:MAG: NUDIX domain-containing protein [Pseudomonadota bacterium]